jgi:GH25 family lysozyme M1 (1,4-beta-N-acetylmuramidase)
MDPVGIDLYPGDGAKDLKAYVAAGPPWCFAVFKLTEGLDYEYSSWARKQRQAFINSPRFGRDLFDGFYHYLTFHQDGRAQAERFWLYMEDIGGERAGTLWAMVDVERGGQRIADPGRALVEDRTSAFAERYYQLSGRRATLYGGELLRATGVRSLLGCGRSAIALYGARLPSEIIERTGTNLKQLLLWQYRGTERQSSGPAGYPLTAPGCGEVDISAMVLPGGLEGMKAGLWSEAQPE